MKFGSIRERSERSWEVKFEIGLDPLTRKRRTRYRTIKGTKADAQAALASLVAAARASAHVDPSKEMLAEYLDRWLTGWAAANVTPRTLQRYRELAKLHIKPHLGRVPLPKLKPIHFVDLYGKLLREGRQRPRSGKGAGLAPRTVGHVHRLLHRALGHAVKWEIIKSNPVSSAEPPRVPGSEVEILTDDQVNAVLQKLRGRSIYPVAAVGLATGLRRGELLALRWKDIDLDGAKLRVEQSLEQTKNRLRFNSPKTRHGRRTVSLPPSIVAELRTLREKRQRIVAGVPDGAAVDLALVKLPDDALVFGKWDGSPMPPDTITKKWGRAVKALKLPPVTLHAWRHTHASQLIAAGLDVLTIARRLGHGSPTITLAVYGHLFSNTDDRAAQVVEAAFARAFGTE